MNNWKYILRDIWPALLVGLFGIFCIGGLFYAAYLEGTEREKAAAKAKAETGVSTLSEYPHPIYKLPVEEGYIVIGKTSSSHSWAVFVPKVTEPEKEED